ncbi:MAG: type II secretion system protein [Clostridia bacterium]|nr:type II secretion system protein [Clostridia bacterium]
MSILKRVKDAKKNKKGFTLVELIVVLVILAILAAMLVPALTGYIDKAREKSVISETRSAVMAAQKELSELYGESTADGYADPDLDDLADLAEDLSEVPGEVSGITIADKKITALTYTSKNDKVCNYTWNETDGSVYDVES